MSQILTYHINREDGIKLLSFWDTLLSVERLTKIWNLIDELRTKNIFFLNAENIDLS